MVASGNDFIPSHLTIAHLCQIQHPSVLPGNQPPPLDPTVLRGIEAKVQKCKEEVQKQWQPLAAPHNRLMALHSEVEALAAQQASAGQESTASQASSSALRSPASHDHASQSHAEARTSQPPSSMNAATSPRLRNSVSASSLISSFRLS